MTEKKRAPAPGIVGLGDLLKQSLAKQGGLPKQKRASRTPTRWAAYNRRRRD